MNEEKKREKTSGFAISIDALLATVLVLSVLAFVGLGGQGDEITSTESTINIKQIADEAFTALLNSGTLAKYLADLELSQTTLSNPANPDSPGIYNEVKELLSENTNLKIAITEYHPAEDADLDICKASKTFEDCFGSTYYAKQEFPSTGLPDEGVMHSRKIVLMKETAAGKETAEGRECIPEQQAFELKEALEEDQAIKALFQGEPVTELETLIEVTDAGGVTELTEGYPLICYDQGSEANETAKVTLKARNRTRDPIAVMLAMDESGSMGIYDMMQGTIAASPPEFDAGTCDGVACVPGGVGNNCGTGYTGWQELGRFQVTDELLNKIPYSNGAVVIYSTPTGGGVCSTVPKIRIRAPNGHVCYNHCSTTWGYYYTTLSKTDLLDRDVAGQDWVVEGWSDVEITIRLYMRTQDGSYTIVVDDGQISGQGQAIGSGVECTDFTNWETVATFNVTEPQAIYVYGRIWYDGYAGQCAPKLRIKAPDGSYSWTDTCGVPSSGSCYSYFGSYSINGPYAQTGTYEIEVWSDYPIIYDAGYYLYKYAGDVVNSITFDQGLCGGVACDAGAPSNCSNYGNWQNLGTFSVDSHIRGMIFRANISGYSGNCPKIEMRLRYPDGTTLNNMSCCGCQRHCDRTITGNPVPYGAWTLEGWSDDPVTYNVYWRIMRIDVAKKASEIFVDNASWKSDDEIGLLSFSSTTALEQALTTDRQLVKDAIHQLYPSGQTAIADAIDSSANELATAPENTGKFLVLLTDGKSNFCRGGIPCSESQATAQAIQAADDARLSGVRIYVIGFADQSIIGAYEADLNNIALDKDDERFKADCESGALQNCGKYYYAADEEALQEMYNIIAFEIARTMEDVKIKIPVPEGMELSNYGSESVKTCGVWDDTQGDFLNPLEVCFGECSSGNQSKCVGGETLTYSNQTITGELWWIAKLDAKMPCNAENCYQEYVLFPPFDAEIIENQRVVSWDGKDEETQECLPSENIKCHKRIPFKYADLNVVFSYGIMGLPSKGNVKIDLEISNDSNRNIRIPSSPLPSGLEIAFYKRDHSNKLDIAWAGGSVFLGEEGDSPVTLLDTISDGNLYLAMSASAPNNICSWKEGNCQPPPTYYPSYWKVRVEGLELSGCNPNCEGTIIAEINKNKQIGECPLHNTAKLICSDERLRFFIIDYYVWVK